MDQDQEWKINTVLRWWPELCTGKFQESAVGRNKVRLILGSSLFC